MQEYMPAQKTAGERNRQIKGKIVPVFRVQESVLCKDLMYKKPAETFFAGKEEDAHVIQIL